MEDDKPDINNNRPSPDQFSGEKPSIHLFTNLVKAMKNEGLIATPKPLFNTSVPGIFTAVLIAAGLAAVGFFAGKSAAKQQPTTPTTQSDLKQYALLVKADDVPPADGTQQFREYTAWVTNLKKDRWAGGEALHGDAYRLSKQNGGVVMSPAELEKNDISGYFLFEAKNLEEAMEIAKTCPHLDYSGTLELREVFR